MQRADWQPWIEWVIQVMRARGVDSLREVARETSVSVSALSGNLSGKHRPSVETVRKLSIHFHGDLDDLLRLSGHGDATIGKRVVHLADPELDILFHGIDGELTPDEMGPVKSYLRFVLEQKRKEKRGQK